MGMKRCPSRIERAAIKALAGVGGDVEWWWFSPAAIGHLRVPVTDDEFALIPEYDGPVADAGDTGPVRRRTRVET